MAILSRSRHYFRLQTHISATIIYRSNTSTSNQVCVSCECLTWGPPRPPLASCLPSLLAISCFLRSQAARLLCIAWCLCSVSGVCLPRTADRSQGTASRRHHLKLQWLWSEIPVGNEDMAPEIARKTGLEPGRRQSGQDIREHRGWPPWHWRHLCHVAS